MVPSGSTEHTPDGNLLSSIGYQLKLSIGYRPSNNWKLAADWLTESLYDQNNSDQMETSLEHLVIVGGDPQTRIVFTLCFFAQKFCSLHLHA